MSWACTVLAGVKRVDLGGVVEEFSPFDSDEEVELGFVYMYYSEAVDLGVAWLLLYHDVHDGFPAFIGVAVGGCIVD